MSRSSIVANRITIGTDSENDLKRIRIGINNELEIFRLEPSSIIKNNSNDLIFQNQAGEEILKLASDRSVSIPGTLTTGRHIQNMVVADLLMELGNGRTGAPGNNDIGLILERGTENNAFIGYDESEDKFTMAFTEATGTDTGALNFTSKGVLSIDSLELNHATNNTIISNNISNIDGSNNTIIGYDAGPTGLSTPQGPLTGANNIIIGYGALPSAADVDNEITLGNEDIDTIRCGGSVIASTSDRRDKTDIIDSAYGADFLKKLRPVQFTWAKRNGSSLNGKKRLGFIAQELQEAMDENNKDILDLVYESNPDYLEAKYSNLIPIMVRAIQELTEKCERLETLLKQYN